MLDSKGKKVNGFKFSKTKKSIINPVKHIRIKGKDFIIVQEENGNINILNRRGESVIDVDSKLFSSINPIWSYLDTFTTSDVDGNLVQIDTKGNIIKTPDNFGDNHLLEMTTKTLVSISENTITIKLLFGSDFSFGTETSSITEKIGVSLLSFILLLLNSLAKFINMLCCN